MSKFKDTSQVTFRLRWVVNQQNIGAGYEFFLMAAVLYSAFCLVRGEVWRKKALIEGVALDDLESWFVLEDALSVANANRRHLLTVLGVDFTQDACDLGVTV